MAESASESQSLIWVMIWASESSHLTIPSSVLEGIGEDTDRDGDIKREIPNF